MAKKAKTVEPRGWVAVKEGTKKEIGFADPNDCKTMEDAMQTFNRTCADHYEVWFRDAKGVLHSTFDEATVEEFD